MTEPLPSSEKEIELLQATFKDNEYLLKLVRSLFFGFPLTDDEKKEIKASFKSAELREAVRKKIYPKLSNDVPIGHVADFWMGTEQNVFGQPRDAIFQAVNSKARVLLMLEQSMKLLENPDGQQVDLTFNPDTVADELQISFLARNLYIKTVETGLHFIKVAADTKKETEKEQENRRKKDSVR